MNKIVIIALAFVGAAVANIALLLVLALLFQWLWNAVPAAVFHLPPINYWQAVRLLLLAMIIRYAAIGVSFKLKI